MSTIKKERPSGERFGKKHDSDERGGTRHLPIRREKRFPGLENGEPMTGKKEVRI